MLCSVENTQGGEKMEFRGLMGGFYRFTEWVMRLSVINVLWIICSIPFFILALMMWFAESMDMAKSILFLMAVISPITVVPATSAMFAVARKWVLGDEDVPLLKTYFRGYRDNFKQSLLGGIIHVIIFLILYVNYEFYRNMENMFSALSILFIFLIVLWAASLFYFFSLLTHMHMKILQVLKNSIMITIGRPLTTFLILITNFGIVLVSFRFTFLFVFFSGSVMAFVTFWHFHRMFGKIQEKREELEKKEQEAAIEGTKQQGSSDDQKTT
jgi:uncharacterized membrane protein YesL